MNTQTGSIRSSSIRLSRCVREFTYGSKQIVISCSNDTTIKIWNVGGISSNEKEPRSIGSKGTLNEDYDYVRCIAYS